MFISNYLIYNKKRTINMIISIIFSILLLLSAGLIFSSIYTYMIKVVEEKNPYHVSFESKNFEKLKIIKKQEYKKSTMYIKYKSARKTYENTKLICTKIKCKNIKYNERLLSLYGVSKNKKIIESFKVALILILTILSVGVYILLSNIFRISLIERKKQIGLLKSIGMTKSLLLKNTLLENTIILIIGLVIGSVLSIWIVQIFLTTLNFLLKDIFTVKLELSFQPLFISISFIFIIIVFYISSLIPAIKVSGLSIIEIINGNNNFSKKKLPKYIFKLKPKLKIIMFNYYRNKKNYKAIKFCIFTCSILYITATIYLKYGLILIDKFIKIPNYDFEIVSNYDENSFQKLNNFGNKYPKHKLYKTCNNDKIMIVQHKKEGIINSKYINLNNQIISKKIAKAPFGFDNIDDKQIVFFTNNLSKYCNNYNLIMFIKGDSNSIKKNLAKMNIAISYVDTSKALKLTKNLILAIKISLYSVLIIVSIICIFLISNTLSISIKLKTKQIGILRSVGFTSKNIKNMLLIETIIILIKTFIYVIPFTILISYILYKSIYKIININMFFPAKELLICFTIILLVFYLCIFFNYLKIKRNRIVEMLFINNT